jgi:hypothetical protein
MNYDALTSTAHSMFVDGLTQSEAFDASKNANSEIELSKRRPKQCTIGTSLCTALHLHRVNNAASAPDGFVTDITCM